MPNIEHQPVMLAETLSLLRPTAEEAYLDLTAGYGGHATAIIDSTKTAPKAVLVDRDAQASQTLQGRFGSEPQIIHSDFLTASRQLAEQGRQFDLILADLGVSSPHLDQGERGFSFRYGGPLDMRMDQTQALTADEIVNHWEEADLADILKRYGQEPKARRIAGLIVSHRPVANTADLAELVKQVWPKASRLHPATRTFQALRIAVNDELAQLADSLPIWLQLLAPGGRLAVISYHSGEDRLVKEVFRQHSEAGYEADIELLTKKPLKPSAHEIAINPRSRSAKLRAVLKINKERTG